MKHFIVIVNMADEDNLERQPERRGNTPLWTPEGLIKYLQGQVADALAKEEAELARGEHTPNGAFVAKMPLELSRAITRGTWHIVMKEPHPRDNKGEFTEVFPVAEITREVDRHAVAKATAFIIHDVTLEGEKWYTLDRQGPYELPDESDDFSEHTPASPDVLLQELGTKLAGRNIVAVALPEAS